MRFILRLICILFALQGFAEEKEGIEVPTNALRDVMLPIGIPVLSSYHTMRESIFLNTSRIDAGLLESMGNFFLAPSQYLFAGKRIIMKNGLECEIVQTFQYDKLHWLKTLGCLIALPFGETLGSALKGLAYLSPEVRAHHQTIQNALASTYVKPYHAEYRLKGLPHLFSEEFIPCLHHKRPSYLTKKQKVEIQALKDIVQLLEAHNIVYWIDCGTCLGAYRYGGIIPWDWDIDISILMYDHDNVKKLLSTLDPKKYQIQDWSSYSKPKTFLKLFVKETKNFIDIYHYQINEEEKTVNYVFTYIDSPFPDSWKTIELTCIAPLKYEQIFPLKRAHFDGLSVRAPHDVVTFLQSKYGENLDPTMVWDEEQHTYQKVTDHPYYQRIQ